MEDIWDTIKITNLQIMGMEEEMHTKGIDNIFNKITAEAPQILRKRSSSKYRRLLILLNRQDQKNTYPTLYYS
jgi:hypothetical protein